MNEKNKKLADAVVGLDIGQHRKFAGVPIRYRFAGSDKNMYASDFIRDWRVVGALETKCLERGWRIELTSTAIRIQESTHPESQTLIIVHGEGPRTRVEACAKALTALPPENASSM